MSDLRWRFPGSRWWKFDFHAHTPASEDYGKGGVQGNLKTISPREWLLEYMQVGIDCVAITDHNSGGWIDKLKAEYKNMEKDRPAGFREIFLFPGIELSVHGGVHILAIFDLSTRTGDIDKLLGNVGFNSKQGEIEGLTEKSGVEVIAEITKNGGLAIPAHVDQECGLLKELQGRTLKQVLECNQIIAVELIDTNFSKPQIYKETKPNCTEVLGSDAHSQIGSDSNIGKRFTWVKMGVPNIEGLRLALLDGSPLSTRRSDDDRFRGDQNQHASLMIEGVEIKNARYCGRGAPLSIRFNPWLNTIIGGRGTGKSTIVEFLRIALRRENELPEKLKDTFKEFRKTPASRNDRGALTEQTEVTLTYMKEGQSFRIGWNQGGTRDAIHSLQKGEKWEKEEGDIPRRFPARIYSQKQIFEMAEGTSSLLEVIDDAPDVNYRVWKDKWDQEENRFLSLRAEIRKIDARLKTIGTIKGDLKDVGVKLKIFESHGHSEVLRDYKKKQRQRKALLSYRESIEEIIEELKNTAEVFTPEDFPSSLFDRDDKTGSEVLKTVEKTNKRIEKLRQQLKEIAREAGTILKDWDGSVMDDRSAWSKTFSETMDKYKLLITQLNKENVSDPSEYGKLVQQKQLLENELNSIEGEKDAKRELEKQIEESFHRLLELRKELTNRRKQFLDEVLKDNKHVKIDLIPFGDKESLGRDFRKVINHEGDRLKNDILSEDGKEGILAGIYKEFSEEKLEKLKNNVTAVAEGSDIPDIKGKWFVKHLRGLIPEALDRLRFWFPTDDLQVEYSPKADGKRYKPIEQGSPGQKTAAILAFLLSYGEEPMILDQPEDDLDNHLIYDLVVKLLRENKIRRQLIVVTHNPNIVVNGDAELVLVLDNKNGQCLSTYRNSLQDTGLREEVCRVMEGGEEAFERRYNRIVKKR